MEEALAAHLAESGGLAALVGPRIQWGVREPGSSLALHLIDSPPNTTHEGRSGLVGARVQADGWAETWLGAKAITDAVIAALPVKDQILGGVRFDVCLVLDREGPVQFGDAPNILFRSRLDLRIWHYSPA